MSSPKSYQQSISVSHPTDEETLLISEKSESGDIIMLDDEATERPSLLLKNKKPLAAACIGAWCVVLMFAGIPALPPMSLLFRGRNLESGNTIKVKVQEVDLITLKPSVGASVHCYDKDWDSNDFMGSGVTGADGWATITYKNIRWDYDTWWGWPDIMCVVSKSGFVDAVPAVKDTCDPSKTTYFGTATTQVPISDDGFFEGMGNKVILFRDRMGKGDYGKTNKCGPDYTGGLPNDIASHYLGFEDQCNNHDKCYYDCQILDAVGGSYRDGFKFCDNEMYYEMSTLCNRNHGNTSFQTDHICKNTANLVYGALNQFGGSHYETGLKPGGDFSCTTPSPNKSDQNQY